MFISSKSVAALSVAASLISSTWAFAPKSSTTSTSTSTKVGAATLADSFGGITNPFAPKQKMPTPPPQAPQNDNDEDPRKGAMAIDIDGIAFSVSCDVALRVLYMHHKFSRQNSFWHVYSMHNSTRRFVHACDFDIS